jgi:hypothetical protein
MALYQPTTENSARARQILETKIQTGRQSAMDLFDRVEQQVPQDSIVRGVALRFNGSAGLRVGLGDGDTLTVHRHAAGQLAQRAGVPPQYLTALLESGEEWQNNLAGEILTRHYNQGEATTRYLTRSVQGQLRGFLSDRYRRLDSRPLLEAFAIECQQAGAVPVDGTVSDTRVALKAILPQVYEPVPGEVLAFGVEWHNSDYGCGTHALRAFMLRVWCLNGATMENALAQVHLGRQLSDEYELSQRTYSLDTRTSISALRDVVRGTFAPSKVEVMCDAIKSANEKQIEWKNVSNAVGRRLMKGELDTAKAAFEGPDVVNLPPGRTTWRASNAISWLAGQTATPERKLDLERLAGELVTGKRDALMAGD